MQVCFIVILQVVAFCYNLFATMPSKKKKKKQDFQKVKLKVGRKLPRPANETRTQFKVRGINIKSQFQCEHAAVTGNTQKSASDISVSSTSCFFLY